MVEEPGEHPRGLEEVERVSARRGVDDDEVEAVVAVQRVQRLGRHVLLGAAERAGDVAVERVAEDPLDLRLVLGVALDQPVERRRVSSIIAHSSPATSEPRSIGCGSAARPSASPSASARRRAGSIVTHHRAATAARRLQPEHGRGRGLADAARPAADDHRRVVEQRAQLTHRATRRGRPTAARRPARRCRPRSARRPAAPGGDLRERQLVGQARQLLALHLRRDRRNAAAARLVADRSRRPTRPPPRSADSRPSSTRVDDDRAELHADLVLERERGLDDLVDRRRLGQRDQHDLATLGSCSSSSTSSACDRTGPRAPRRTGRTPR